MTRPPKNIAASVRAKLALLSESTGEEYNLLLLRHAVERLLYRIAESEHHQSFVLKGAMLFVLWDGHPYRVTRDLDLLGFGEPTPERLAAVFMSLCTMAVAEDGVQFVQESVAAEAIRTIDEYGGVRVTLRARIGSAVIPVQVDVGFGDAMTPPPIIVEFPTLLGMPAPKLRAYAKETVVAEKTEAIVRLGMLNTRMKDYFDLHALATRQSFDGALLQRAVRATFERRGTPIPVTMPIGLAPEFGAAVVKQTQWQAFCRKSRVAEPTTSLAEVVEVVAAFVRRPLLGLNAEPSFRGRWTPGVRLWQ